MLELAGAGAPTASGSVMDYHTRFLALVDEIERRFPVTQWKIGDVPVWPLVRADLYVDLYRQDYAPNAVAAADLRQQKMSARVLRWAGQAATPLTNIWQARAKLAHVLLFPRRADVMFFGDGVSLEPIDGVWRDRFFEPIVEEVHRTDRSVILVQRGRLEKLPRSTPVFPANTVENWAPLLAAVRRRVTRQTIALPDHESVITLLESRGTPTQSLMPERLLKRASVVSATASGFEKILRTVRPTVCFMVTLGTGHALALACRRCGVLSVELQRSGLGVCHEEYLWSAIPENGYSVLPAVFWTWTEEDSAPIDQWSKAIKLPWHRSICGGHPQLAPWFDERNPQTCAFDAKISALKAGHPSRLNILVALQNHDGYLDTWNELAAFIERAPADWRWWLRRHPYGGTSDKEIGRIAAIRRPNVLIDEASSFPLPALLRHMDAFVSIRSGAAIEASMFGLRPIFLSHIARDLFPTLFATGKAEIVDNVNALTEHLPATLPAEKRRIPQPPLDRVMSRLNSIAAEYADLCRRSVFA